jgi:hypothetical protein
MRENKSLTNQTLDSHRKTKTKDQDLLYPCRSAQIRGKLSPQKNTARTSHPSRIVRRTLSACLPAARRRDNGTGPTALTRSATFTSTSCKIAIRRIDLPQLIAAGQRPHPLIERAVKEAAVPGQPARARAHFPISPGNSPSRIASCHQRHRNHRSASVESSNVFDEPTLRQNVAPRNRKSLRSCAETVEDESSLWKPEEIGARTAATKLCA